MGVIVRSKFDLKSKGVLEINRGPQKVTFKGAKSVIESGERRNFGRFSEHSFSGAHFRASNRCTNLGQEAPHYQIILDNIV